MASHTLGLDIGSNSIGWALLQTQPQPSIVDMGVRVFPKGWIETPRAWRSRRMRRGERQEVPGEHTKGATDERNN